MCRILLITNDESEKEGFLKIAENHNISHHIVSSVNDIFQLIEDDEFDIILLSEVVKKNISAGNFLNIWENIQAKSIPFVLIVPVDLSKEQLLVYLEFGFDNLIFKPFNEKVFMTKVRSITRRKMVYDIFKSTDFFNFLEFSEIAYSYILKNKILKANKSMMHILGRQSMIENQQDAFTDVFQFMDEEVNRAEFSRFINGLSDSIVLTNVLVNNSVLKNLRLFRGNHSSLNSFLVEIGADEFKNVEYVDSDGFINLEKLLTKKESKVYKLSETGLPIKVIAEKLNISPRTVERHRASIMHKLGANNILEAISKVKSYSY